MRKDQTRFLQKIAHWIPVSFEEIRRGNASCEIVRGIRRAGDRRIRLFIRVEVMDLGRNPVETHGLCDNRDHFVEYFSMPDHSSYAVASSQG